MQAPDMSEWPDYRQEEYHTAVDLLKSYKACRKIVRDAGGTEQSEDRMAGFEDSMYYTAEILADSVLDELRVRDNRETREPFFDIIYDAGDSNHEQVSAEDTVARLHALLVEKGCYAV